MQADTRLNRKARSSVEHEQPEGWRSRGLAQRETRLLGTSGLRSCLHVLGRVALVAVRLLADVFGAANHQLGIGDGTHHDHRNT